MYERRTILNKCEEEAENIKKGLKIDWYKGSNK